MKNTMPPRFKKWTNKKKQRFSGKCDQKAGRRIGRHFCPTFHRKWSQKTSQNDPETAPRGPWAPKDGAKVAPKAPQIRPSGPRDHPKGPPGLKMEPKWSPNGRQGSKRCQNDAKMEPKWHPNGVKKSEKTVKIRPNWSPKPVKRRNHVETMNPTAYMKLPSFDAENRAPPKRRNPKNRSNRHL